MDAKYVLKCVAKAVIYAAFSALATCFGMNVSGCIAIGDNASAGYPVSNN